MKYNKLALGSLFTILITYIILGTEIVFNWSSKISNDVSTNLFWVIFQIIPLVVIILSIISTFQIKNKNQKGKLISAISIIFSLFLLIFLLLALTSECGISSRCKTRDNVTKANLAQVRTVAETYADSKTPRTYVGLCKSPDALANINEAEKYSGNKVECNDSKTTFALQVKLHSGSYYCVDSPRTDKIITSIIQGALTCN